MSREPLPPPEFSGDTKPASDDWDEEEAEWLRGKYVLVGVTWTNPFDADDVEQSQYHGRVVQADKTAGVVVACEGLSAGETLTLPPVTKCFEPAARGEYRLRSTGEVVVDPEATATWTIAKARTS